jgi:hypothetical protein
MDVAQLVRWSPPDPFVRAFEAAYRDGGGALPDDWRRWVAALDVCYLVGLARSQPQPRKIADVRRRILQTLAVFGA